MINDYAWRRQTPATQVFGVIGCPVAHSISPAIFNAQFRRAGVDAVYLPLLIESEAEFRGFIGGCRSRHWLNVCGFSVTVPHKHAALAVASDETDPFARRIGAANTLVLHDNGIAAYNTDHAGALAALASGLGLGAVELGGLPVTVLGAGGVSRAVVAGLVTCGARVTIYNRSPARAQDLASDFDCHTGDWDDRHRHEGRLVINCTSIGMTPAIDETPMPPNGLRAGLAVFDTVYNPRETKLLRLARAAGCRTLDGVAMFIQQAAAQYRIWTSQVADLSVMEKIVSDRLG
jgi:3-dehydroquinate dehydratase/shikimate dehydrogenase